MTKALLPCPFCGSAAKIWRLTTYWGVECFAAHERACISLPACYLTEQDAINAWNTRAHAPQPDLQETLHKLIGQMEGMKCKASNHEHDGHVGFNNAIDRCIALVRAAL